MREGRTEMNRSDRDYYLGKIWKERKLKEERKGRNG